MKPALVLAALVLWSAPVAAQSWTATVEEAEAFCVLAALAQRGRIVTQEPVVLEGIIMPQFVFSR